MPSSKSTLIRPSSYSRVSTKKRLMKNHVLKKKSVTERSTRTLRPPCKEHCPNEQIPPRTLQGITWNYFWEYWTEVTKPLQWRKHPEEAKNINIKQGDEKHHRNTNKLNGMMEHTLTKNQFSPVNTTKQPCRLIKGPYQESINPQNRKKT